MIQPQNGNRSHQAPRKEGQTMVLSAELVRRVSDRVYELWRDDLRLERERQRLTNARRHQR